MLNKRLHTIFFTLLVLLTSCMKEIDGPIDIALSDFPKFELNLDKENDYKSKIYFSLATKSIVKTSDNFSWHIAFTANTNLPARVIMNYALGTSTRGITLSDTNWSRIPVVSDFIESNIRYANHYDSFADLFTKGLSYVYYLNYMPNLANKKFQILDYTSTAVTFRVANYDGSGEYTKMVALNPNTNYTYINLQTGEVADIEPSDKLSWDFEVTRYTTYVTDFSQPQMYAVGGFISNPAKTIEVAKIESKNLEDVAETIFPNLVFSSKLNSIGYDWKKFSNAGPDGFYTILPRSYIVRTDGRSYGIQFVGYSKTINSATVNGFPSFLLRDF